MLGKLTLKNIQVQMAIFISTRKSKGKEDPSLLVLPFFLIIFLIFYSSSMINLLVGVTGATFHYLVSFEAIFVFVFFL